MSSKAQGLSLNTIVIAAIVLVVLVVVVMVFTGSIGNFVPGLSSASERQCSGANLNVRDSCSDFEQQFFAKFSEGSVPAGKVCCRTVKELCPVSSSVSCIAACGTPLKHPAGLRYVCSSPNLVCCQKSGDGG